MANQVPGVSLIISGGKKINRGLVLFEYHEVINMSPTLIPFPQYFNRHDAVGSPPRHPSWEGMQSHAPSSSVNSTHEFPDSAAVLATSTSSRAFCVSPLIRPTAVISRGTFFLHSVFSVNKTTFRPVLGPQQNGALSSEISYVRPVLTNTQTPAPPHYGHPILHQSWTLGEAALTPRSRRQQISLALTLGVVRSVGSDRGILNCTGWFHWPKNPPCRTYSSFLSSLPPSIPSSPRTLGNF